MTGHTSTYYNLGYTQLLAPANRTSTTASNSIDLQNCDDATLQFNVGAIGDTLSGTNKMELEVQESDDNSTFTAVADADLTKVVTGATNTGTAASFTSGTTGQNTVYITGYRGNKRYIRGNVRFSGTISVGTPTAITSITGRNRQQPMNA